MYRVIQKNKIISILYNISERGGGLQPPIEFAPSYNLSYYACLYFIMYSVLKLVNLGNSITMLLTLSNILNNYEIEREFKRSDTELTVTVFLNF